MQRKNPEYGYIVISAVTDLYRGAGHDENREMGRLDRVKNRHQFAALFQAYTADVVDVHGDVVVEQVAGGRGRRAGRSELRHFPTFTTQRHHKSTKQPWLLLDACAHNLTFLTLIMFLFCGRV